MDHLPRVSRPVCSVPAVPFLEVPGIVYQGPIHGFKYGSHQVETHPDKIPDLQYSYFVQQWLYFGVLSEFFGIWNIPVPQSDFVTEQDGVKTVSNRLLADYIVACTAKEFNQNQAILRDKRASNVNANYTKAQLTEATARMDKGLELFNIVHAALQHDVVQEAIHPAIWDSVILLVGLLIRFWQILYGSTRPETITILTPDLSGFTFRSITDMRLNKQFCVHEQKLILRLVDSRPNDIAFFSLLGPNQDGKSHEMCRENECEAYQVKTGEPYHTLHTSECDGLCAFVGLDPDFWISEMEARAAKEPPQGGLAETLYRIVPESFSKLAAAVTFEDNKLTAHNVRLMMAKTAGWLDHRFEDVTMVAFSHVWADGLGNPGSNSLPTCQLKRLQELANNAYGNPKRNVPFWFDTLLIPVRRSDLVGDEAVRQEKIKTNALRDMEWVYKYASKVLVLDRRLFELDSTDMEPEEIGARIMCSVWSRRLWTLQEGCSRNKTIFKFRDKWVHWPHLHEQVLARGDLGNWKHKGSKLPKDHHIVKAKLQSIKFLVDKKGNHFDSYENAAPGGVTLPIVEAMTAAGKRLYKTTSQNWHSVYRFLEELTIDWSGSARAAALPRCMRGMYYRNCSRPEDEALVLASMIAETPGLAAKLTEECEDAKQRYVYLMKQLKEVPEDFLFLDQLRYNKDGERWIPRSLLGVSAADYLPPYRSDTLPSRYSIQFVSRRRISTLCTRTDEGIEVGLTGLKLIPSLQGINAPFRFKWWNSSFVVTLKHPGEPLKGSDDTEEDLSEPLKHAGEPIHSLSFPGDQYALIFERLVDITNNWTTTRAALISVTEWFKSEWRFSTGGKGDFRALATVTRLEPAKAAAIDLPLVSIEEPRTKMSKWVRPLQNSGRSGPLQRWIIG